MKIIIINGPNLNLLGKREVEIYGSQSFEDYFETLKKAFAEIELQYFQSNSEGALMDKLHEVGFSYDGIIVNLAGYTHTSVALADAIAAIKTPVIEVHISNIHAREAFRHKTFTGAKSVGIISGLGLQGYELAIRYLLKQ
ncbi:MAG: 3-dehydroquinate dehydratase-2 [Cyclobacteriaceae bacterium]|jgi:3-dehydroquinate dehydratase-2